MYKCIGIFIWYSNRQNVIKCVIFALTYLPHIMQLSKYCAQYFKLYQPEIMLFSFADLTALKKC